MLTRLSDADESDHEIVVSNINKSYQYGVTYVAFGDSGGLEALLGLTSFHSNNSYIDYASVRSIVLVVQSYTDLIILLGTSRSPTDIERPCCELKRDRSL